MTILSTAGVEAVNAQHKTDPILVLLTIEHAKLSAPLRLARNRQAVRSRGELYLAFPFEIELPTDGDRAPEARLTASNVSRRVGRMLESIDTGATVSIELILASEPDTVERAWYGLSFSTATWTAAAAQLTIGHLDFWDEPWPRKRVTPSKFPGLFP